MSAISFLAGMGAGYIKAKDKALENERQAARDKREQDTFDMQKSEYDQKRSDRDELRQAAAPVTVTPEQGPPTEAQHVQAKLEDRQPDSIGYRVGNGRNAQMFAERGVADATASQQNTVDGTRTRTAAAMAAQGNVLGADQLRTSGIQASAAELALKEGQQAAADKALKKRIDGFKTPEEMAAFMTESPADKAGGEFKAQARYAADRKTFTFDKVNPDGTFTPTGQVFENSAQGMDKARMTLAGFMTPEQRIQHYQFEETKAEQARHNKATEDVAKQNANTQEQYRRDMAANQRAQLALTASHNKAIEAGKSAAGAPVQIGLKDMRDFESDMAGYIKDQFPVNQGTDANDRATLNAQATSLKALGSAMFRNNAAVGIPLTAGTVMQAMELGKDRKNVQIVQVNGVPHESVVVNGQHVITSGQLQKRPAPAAAPVPANTPAAAAQNGVAPPQPATKPVPAAQPQKPPSSLDQIQSSNMAEMGQLAQQYKQATAQFVAALNSGDTKSIGVYMQQKEVLRKQLEQQAAEKFGNGAAAALQKLTAN